MDRLHAADVQGKQMWNLNLWTWRDVFDPIKPPGQYMKNLVDTGRELKVRLAVHGIRLVKA